MPALRVSILVTLVLVAAQPAAGQAVPSTGSQTPSTPGSLPGTSSLPGTLTGPLTKTSLPGMLEHHGKRKSHEPETFDLDPTLDVSLDAAPSAPAAIDGKGAYVALSTGKLVAIDMEEGKLRWSYDLVTTVPPGVDGGLVVAAGDEVLTAFDAMSGAARWSVPLPGGAVTSPLVDSGWVLTGSPDGTVMAVRGADGQVLWKKALGATLAARPFIAADAAYFSLSDHRVVSLSLLTGEPRWERTFAGTPGELLVLDDRLFVGAEDKFFYCLKTSNGKDRWRRRCGGKPSGSPAVDEKLVYYVAFDNILWAIDRNGGSLRWKANLPVRPSGGPLVVGKTVVVAGVAFEVYGYSAGPDGGVETGKASYNADLAGPPQLVGGTSGQPGIAGVTREGNFQILRRRLEPAPIPMPYPLGDEIPLSFLPAVSPSS